jgi:hypothetical protein
MHRFITGDRELPPVRQHRSRHQSPVKSRHRCRAFTQGPGGNRQARTLPSEPLNTWGCWPDWLRSCTAFLLNKTGQATWPTAIVHDYAIVAIEWLYLAANGCKTYLNSESEASRSGLCHADDMAHSSAAYSPLRTAVRTEPPASRYAGVPLPVRCGVPS